MVNTIKFSDFLVAPLTNPDNEVVGLENGANIQSVRFLTWTTATRPEVPFNGLLGLNTDLEEYEFWNSVAMEWVQLAVSNVLAELASHDPGLGASLIGLQNQSNVNNMTVQDLANATFIAQTDNDTLQNGQFLGDLTTGIVKSTTATGVLSISAPLTSIDGLVTDENEFLITTAPNTYTTLGPMSDGQLIIGSTDNIPALKTLTQGTGIIIDNTPGDIKISATASGINKIKIIKFPTHGTFTYTPSVGLVSAIFECIGPAGGSGGCAAIASTGAAGSGGGGAGEYARTAVDAAAIGASQVVTVGQGGAGGASGANPGLPGSGPTSIGTLCVANPGQGGAIGSGGGARAGGLGGTGGTGDITIPGQSGPYGSLSSVTTVVLTIMPGAQSYFGGGIGGFMALGTGAQAIPGAAATGFGNGGRGSGLYAIGGTPVAGGPGSGGLALITEFLSV